MASQTKTDNHTPGLKLNLRRYFLRKYHSDGKARVVDCCMGGGLLWGVLRQEFPVAAYIGMDVKRKIGRLKVDSARYLQAGGWTHNVIDVDTYGAPWKHWEHILNLCTWDVTVFLTIGFISMGGGGQLDNYSRSLLGLDGINSLPMSLGGRLHDISVVHCLSQPLEHGFDIAECVESDHFGSARYIGVRLTRKK